MAKKYYAVRHGKTRGIFLTWDDCRKQVEGFAGAAYKSFSSLSEAEDYISSSETIPETQSEISLSKSESRLQRFESPSSKSLPIKPIPGSGNIAVSNFPAPETSPHHAVAYVDGSYDKKSGDFSYGMVIFVNGEQHNVAERFTDSTLAEMHNVAGEIKGALAAMQFCLDHEIERLDLYYDYEGIAKWCLGAWQAKKEGTREYAEFYRSIRSRLEIRFVKVKGHSGDPYNDLADRLARHALGIR